MARYSTIKNVAPLLLDPNSGLNILPEGLGWQALPTESGGYLTGNIEVNQPRTTTGLFQDLLTDFVPLLSGNPSTILTTAATQTIKGLASDRAYLPGQIVGRVPVGFFDDIFGGSSEVESGGFDQGLSNTSFNWGGLLNTGGNLLINALSGGGRSQGVPQTYGASMSAVPAVIGAGGMVVRGAGSMIASRLAGIGLTRASAYTMLKKFGPASLVGLGLTAAEVAMVARSKGGYRRMNMCNGRALRRASRRLEGFHKFYKRTCGLPVHRKKSTKYCK